MSCAHTYTVEDHHEGSIVCTDCNRVLDQLYACDKREPYEQTVFNKNTSEIVDIFDTLFAPRALICSFEEKLRKNLQLLNVRKTNHLVGACLYEVFIENNISKTLSEISSVLQTSTSLIWKTLAEIQKSQPSINVVCPMQLTSRVCHALDLTYKDCKDINEKLLPVCARFPFHNPSTLVGTIVYLHCKEAKLKYTMKRVCNTVGISVISIQRFIKKLK